MEGKNHAEASANRGTGSAESLLPNKSPRAVGADTPSMHAEGEKAACMRGRVPAAQGGLPLFTLP